MNIKTKLSGATAHEDQKPTVPIYFCGTTYLLKAIIPCKDRYLSKGSYRSEGMHTVTEWNGQLKNLIRNRGPIGTFTANSFCLNNRVGSFYLRGQMRRSTSLQYRDIAVVEEKIEKKLEQVEERIREQVDERIEGVAESFSLISQRMEDLEKKLLPQILQGLRTPADGKQDIRNSKKVCRSLPLKCNLAFSDFSANVREMICLEYFVDGLKDEEIQMAVRMAGFKDLKSALLYALKGEATNEASCRDSHSVRGATDVPCESPWWKEIEKLREEIQDLMAQRQDLKRRRITCWGCGGAGHLRSSCPRINKEDHNIKCWVCGRTGHTLFGEQQESLQQLDAIDPVIRQVTTPSTLTLDPWSDGSVRKDPWADPELEFKESSDEKPSWQDIASYNEALLGPSEEWYFISKMTTEKHSGSN
ncbi:UNVERIFIED_CONTAM: hypothetical protein NCL1_54662 [Trichonephila clavipes]